MYKGFFKLWARNIGLFNCFFLIYDSCKRHTELLNYKMGQFMVTGSAASLGYAIMWPAEILKNLEQAENTLIGTNTRERVDFIYRHHGIAGFYRGILPGLQSVFFRNGASMVVMQYANKVIKDNGWRE